MSRVQLICISFPNFAEFSGKAISITGQLAMSLYTANPDNIIYPVVVVALTIVIFLVSIVDLALGFWISKGTPRDGSGLHSG